MSGWLIAWIAFQALGHGALMFTHGVHRKNNYFGALIGSGVSYGMLYMAGVFS